MTSMALPYFFHIINGTGFGTKLLNTKYVFLFSLQLLSKTSHSKYNSVKYRHKWAQVFMQSTRYFRQILIKREFSKQIFEKFSNIEFHENPSSGNRVVPFDRPYGLTDRHEEARSRFSQYLESA